MLSVHRQTKAVRLNLSNYAVTCRPAASGNKSSWSHHFINCILIATFTLTIWEMEEWSEGYLVVKKRKWTEWDLQRTNPRMTGCMVLAAGIPSCRRNLYFSTLVRWLYLHMSRKDCALNDNCVLRKALSASWWWICLVICRSQACWHMALCLCLRLYWWLHPLCWEQFATGAMLEEPKEAQNLLIFVLVVILLQGCRLFL